MEDRSEHQRSSGPTMLEDLMARTRHFLTGMLADHLKRSVDEVLRWLLSRAMRYAIMTALFIMAAGFLLLGASEGLILAGMPLYLVHLAVGVASLLAGLVFLKCCTPHPDLRR